jgi:vacuolar-type H+-ATPase subunit H
MQQHSEPPEFMKTVKEIRDAEEEHDRVISSSKEKAERIVREAKEKSLEARVKSEEETVTFKNERLKKGGQEIEGEVQKIVKKAKDDGVKVSKKGLDATAVSKLVKEFLGSL